MRRKNPLSGAADLQRLFVREVTDLGEDDDALHTVRGQMDVDGDIDMVVLRVKENAEVERILLVGRLEVGGRGGGGHGSGGYPSGGSGGGPPSGGTPSGGYPSGGYPYGGYPAGKGASIDEKGTVRTDGWVVVGNSEKGLVLRSPEGRYFGFTVDDAGKLEVQGTFLGFREP